MSFIIPKNTKKILIAKTSNEDLIKDQKSKYCAQYNSNNIEDMEGYNTYLFKMKKDFFVVDVDCEDALNYVNELINKHDVKVDDLKMTRSISNINKID